MRRVNVFVASPDTEKRKKSAHLFFISMLGEILRAGEGERSSFTLRAGEVKVKGQSRL